MLKRTLFLTFISLALFQISAIKSGSQLSTNRYIDQFRAVAIFNQQEYGIPASITLAQGIHESASGTSKMAKQANNHFGIKCIGWTGDSYFTGNGKKRGGCYRAYDMPEDSYCDHARILKSKARYAFLFELDPTDYKAWAKGLKKAGYAGDPKYAAKLIKVIEDYNLNEITQSVLADTLPKVEVSI